MAKITIPGVWGDLIELLNRTSDGVSPRGNGAYASMLLLGSIEGYIGYLDMTEEEGGAPALPNFNTEQVEQIIDECSYFSNPSPTTVVIRKLDDCVICSKNDKPQQLLCFINPHTNEKTGGIDAKGFKSKFSCPIPCDASNKICDICLRKCLRKCERKCPFCRRPLTTSLAPVIIENPRPTSHTPPTITCTIVSNPISVLVRKTFGIDSAGQLGLWDLLCAGLEQIKNAAGITQEQHINSMLGLVRSAETRRDKTFLRCVPVFARPGSYLTPQEQPNELKPLYDEFKTKVVDPFSKLQNSITPQRQVPRPEERGSRDPPIALVDLRRRTGVNDANELNPGIAMEVVESGFDMISGAQDQILQGGEPAGDAASMSSDDAREQGGGRPKRQTKKHTRKQSKNKRRTIRLMPRSKPKTKKSNRKKAITRRRYNTKNKSK